MLGTVGRTVRGVFLVERGHDGHGYRSLPPTITGFREWDA